MSVYTILSIKTLTINGSPNTPLFMIRIQYSIIITPLFYPTHTPLHPFTPRTPTAGLIVAKR